MAERHVDWHSDIPIHSSAHIMESTISFMVLPNKNGQRIYAFAFCPLPWRNVAVVCIQFYCLLAQQCLHTLNSITIFASLTNSQTIMIQSSFLGLFSLPFALCSPSPFDDYFVICEIRHATFMLRIEREKERVRNGVCMMCSGRICTYTHIYCVAQKSDWTRVVFVSCIFGLLFLFSFFLSFVIFFLLFQYDFFLLFAVSLFLFKYNNNVPSLRLFRSLLLSLSCDFTYCSCATIQDRNECAEWANKRLVSCVLFERERAKTYGEWIYA